MKMNVCKYKYVSKKKKTLKILNYKSFTFVTELRRYDQIHGQNNVCVTFLSDFYADWKQSTEIMIQLQLSLPIKYVRRHMD